MHKVGSVLGFLINKITLLIFSILLLASIPILSLTSTVTDQEEIKQILAESNIYENLPANILDLVEVGSLTEESDSTLPPQQEPLEKEKKSLREVIDENGFINSTALSSTITSVFDSAFLRQQTESLVDSVYAFASGESPELTYNFSLKERSDEAAQSLKSLINDGIAKLPPCTPQDISAQLGSNEEFNVFEATCLPPGTTVDAEVDKFVDQLTGPEGALGQTITNERSKDDNTINFEPASTEVIKTAYGIVSKLPFIIWPVLIGLALIIILTSKYIHRGFKYVGALLITTGVMFLAGFAFILGSLEPVNNFVLNNNELSSAQQTAIKNVAEPVADKFLGHVSANGTITAAIVVVLGIACFIIGILLKKHHVDHLELHHHDETEQAKPPEIAMQTDMPAASPAAQLKKRPLNAQPSTSNKTKKIIIS